MDQAKNFENFLKLYNICVIANEYENACLRRTYLHRAKNLSRTIKNTKMIARDDEWMILDTH